MSDVFGLQNPQVRLDRMNGMARGIQVLWNFENLDSKYLDFSLKIFFSGFLSVWRYGIPLENGIWTLILISSIVQLNTCNYDFIG